MARIPSLPDPTNLSDVFQQFPVGIAPLLAYHDELLRGESPLSPAQREMIAAFVSGLNGCEFCFGGHQIIAETFGVDPGLLEHCVRDRATAAIEDDFRVLLGYIEKLTRTPAKLTDADAAAVLDAGWSERALHDAVAVCALFNFMNRLVEGMGVVSNEMIRAAQRKRHQEFRGKQSNTPYQDYGRKIGVLAAE